MLRMVIVDDEAIILQGLREIVDWQALGYEMVGSYLDGAALLDALRSGLPVDVILTDIRMDHVSGIEIARHVHENALPVKVVLLSGYADFEYARQAIAYGVTEYLTKPCSLMQIREVFTRLAASIHLERAENIARLSRLQEARTVTETLREWVVANLLGGGLPRTGQTEQMLRALVERMEPLSYPARLLSLSFQPDNQELREAVRRSCVLPYLARNHPAVTATFASVSGRLSLLLQAQDADALPDGDALRALCEYVRQMIGVAIQWKVEADCENLLALWTDGAAAPDGVAADQRLSALRDLLDSGFAAQAQTEGSHTQAVRLACEYIRTHCGEPLTLVGVARKTYMHPSYLSRIFKEKTGRTFKAYLTQCRVDLANELLRDPMMKVYDVAGQVGYHDIRHFYDVYKRHTGKTPSGYRAALCLQGFAEE